MSCCQTLIEISALSAVLPPANAVFNFDSVQFSVKPYYAACVHYIRPTGHMQLPPLQPDSVAMLLCAACAGKTHLAQRLAQLYGLLHINTAAVLAELPLMDAETQKVRTGPCTTSTTQRHCACHAADLLQCWCFPLLPAGCPHTASQQGGPHLSAAAGAHGAAPAGAPARSSQPGLGDGGLDAQPGCCAAADVQRCRWHDSG